MRCSEPEAQAVFCRRRHQPSRPPPAKIRPGSPAPTMGPGTVTPLSVKAALNWSLGGANDVGADPKPIGSNIASRVQL